MRKRRVCRNRSSNRVNGRTGITDPSISVLFASECGTDFSVVPASVTGYAARLRPTAGGEVHAGDGLGCCV